MIGSRSSAVRWCGACAASPVAALGAAALFKTIHHVQRLGLYLRLSRLSRQCSEKGRRPLWRQASRGGGFACMVELLLKLNALGVEFAEIPLQLRLTRNGPDQDGRRQQRPAAVVAARALAAARFRSSLDCDCVILQNCHALRL